ncbi:MAG: class I SAM-dependent methyltransferase [Candidatus Yanofskybacteria bacterium]|nr:class I SAM-dependent methyltransferase [Candidatus Yanofskybacteria bacterium]
MGSVTKISFPYFLKVDYEKVPVNERIIVFFGTDFYNLPLGSNRKEYIDRTNRMLDYIRTHFPGRQLLYLPHPNEVEEFQHLNLEGFTFRDHTIGELFLYENAESIEYVFSSCSWTSGSAFAMGFNAAVFLETMVGAVSEDTIIGYRSYFFGLPKYFFIDSFAEPPIKRSAPGLREEKRGASEIERVIANGDNKKAWILAGDPALALRAAILLTPLRVKIPTLKTGLIMINHRRWDLIAGSKTIFGVFDEVVKLPHKKVWYSGRLGRILNAIHVAHEMRKLPLVPGDVFISLSNLLFEENCILSYYPGLKKVLLLESRWYNFIYEGGSKALPAKGFHESWGTRVFNYLLEPLLGLQRTIFREFLDGKVINFFRYKKPLEIVYNYTFILMPSSFDGSVVNETVFRPKLSTGSKFRKRLITSRFGLEKLKSITFGRLKQRRIIKAIKNGSKVTSRRELQTLLGAPGLINDQEVSVLQKYASQAPSIIVEIGPAYGGSSLLFLLGKQLGTHLYSIDPFVTDSKGDFRATRELCYKYVSRALIALNKVERLAEWTILSDYSYNVAKNWQKSIDLLFIDGDHNYEAVKKDFADWFPLVNKNGFIIFHDSCRVAGTPDEICDRGWPGPTQLVGELTPDSRVKLCEQVFSLSIFQKVND